MKIDNKPNYDEVSKNTWKLNDLSETNLLNSLSLFDITNKHISPKNFEVIALLSGLPFSSKLTNLILKTQNKISNIIKDKKHYWVKNDNLGLEHCVFKWPEDKINQNKINSIKDFVSKINFKSYEILFDGCQMNSDGCIVIRGFDKNDYVYQLRSFIKKNYLDLPNKQSNWYHIPIGRILEPVGQNNFKKLKFFFDNNKRGWQHFERINNFYLVHEHKWYMEDKSFLLEVKVN